VTRAVVLAAITATAAAAPAAAAAAPVTIDRPGFWSLERLGYGDVRLRENPDTARSEASVVYRLPHGAAAGPGSWYLIRLHYVVRIRPEAREGTFNVAAATNGRTAASTIFEVRRRGGRLVVTSDDLGLVAGHVRRTSHALRQEIRFENFLQFAGVRPGRNVLTFQLTSNALPMVEEVRILADSGIELSPRGPATVRAGISVPTREIVRGEPFDVVVRVRRVRGRPLPRAVVEAAYPAGALDGPRARVVPWGRPRVVESVFRLSALRSGRIPITVRATAGTVTSQARTVVFVAEPAEGRPLWWVAAGVAAAVAVAAAASFAVRRRREHPPA
jgi:hypothetical protein